MAINYRVQKNYSKALEYYEKSLKIREELNDKKAVAGSLNNIATLYQRQELYEKAEEYFKKSVKMKLEINDKNGLIYSYEGLANIYTTQQKFAEAIEYGEKALNLAKETKANKEYQSVCLSLYELYKAKKDYELSLFYFEKHKKMSDSLFNVEKSKAIANLETKVELEKKERELQDLAKDNELNKLNAERKERELEINKKQAEADRLFALAKEEKNKRKADSLRTLAQKAQLEADNMRIRQEKDTIEIKKQKENSFFLQIIVYLVLAGFISVLIFAFFVYRSRQLQKKLNEQLSEKTMELSEAYAELQTTNEELHQSQEEIIAQRDFIEEQNKDLAYHNTQVKHSITTALAIQKALLPFDNRVGGFLKEYFVLYQPKDIVSGDFYWIEKVNETEIIVIAADCTGHGVPGAFMSLVAINLLEKVVLQQGETQGCKELFMKQTNRSIYQDFRHNGG